MGRDGLCFLRLLDGCSALVKNGSTNTLHATSNVEKGPGLSFPFLYGLLLMVQHMGQLDPDAVCNIPY